LTGTDAIQVKIDGTILYPKLVLQHDLYHELPSMNFSAADASISARDYFSLSHVWFTFSFANF
jgi:hypothetical protein